MSTADWADCDRSVAYHELENVRCASAIAASLPTLICTLVCIPLLDEDNALRSHPLFSFGRPNVDLLSFAKTDNCLRYPVFELSTLAWCDKLLPMPVSI